MRIDPYEVKPTDPPDGPGAITSLLILIGVILLLCWVFT